MRKGTIKTTTAFRYLNKARQEQRNASCQFAVYHVKKNGELYQNPDTYCQTLEQAKEKALRWEGLNPGSKWEVCDANGQIIEGWR